MFKIGDAVKFDTPYSVFVTYGTIIKVTKLYAYVKEHNGIVTRVNKKFINFD